MGITGVGAGMVDVAVLTAASRVQAASGTPVMGRVQSVFFAGLVVGGGIGVAIVALGLSYRVSFVITGLLLLAACCLAARSLVLPAIANPATGHLSLRGVLAIAGIPVLIALAFGGFFLEGATTSFAAVLLRNAIGSTAVIASTAAFVVSVGLAIGAYAADALVARLGARRTMAVGATLAAVGVAAAATATVPATAVVGLGIASIGFGGIGPGRADADGADRRRVRRRRAADRDGPVVPRVPVRSRGRRADGRPVRATGGVRRRRRGRRGACGRVARRAA